MGSDFRFIFTLRRCQKRLIINNKKAMIQNYILLTLLNQALFFTGFWTTPTNGFGGFLSLEKNP